ncbi:carboxypeptidase-like protein [Balneicella halophila]|uniref:Carboxypeptidase-like protein n=1 Tax=Balneicella halophila TaxID=1537566 RepID=A0A7L4UPD9_BALHA|nr:carboxypeptidase-like regulatory domain-containing protein [Balneicella halophila]PVX50991.1 carboxypeptidase-like protein [Balneicella halophila]
MKRFLLVLLTVLIFSSIKAENKIYTGRVEEAGGENPVPFAMLIIKNTLYGVQADENGDYVLDLPAGYEQDSIVVSSLSYKEKTIAISDLMKNQLIKLELDSNVLGEVVIYPINPYELLEKAAKNRAKNHDVDHSTVQRNFNRELYFDKGVCFRASENIVDAYKLKLPKHTTGEYHQINKTLKARGIQDSLQLWTLNDMFKMKEDTISFFNEAITREITGLDPTILFSEISREQDAVEESDEDSNKKGLSIGLDVSSELKYNGTMKYRGRTSHRVLVELIHKRKTIIKGQLLIDSATYAFSEIRIANQNVDLYKEFVPWIARSVIRLMGYRPVLDQLTMMNSYAIGNDGKWYKTYDYLRFGGSMRKKRRLLDSYAESEFFYQQPRLFDGDATAFWKKNKDAKDAIEETDVTSFNNDSFWEPYVGRLTPEKVKKCVVAIHERNQEFQGEIGYNKKESRRKRREERRQSRK